MVTLKPIDESNYDECIALSVAEEQRQFVAPNMYSLAEAYIYYGQCHPLGAYDGDTMVGFIMYGFNKESGKHEIYRVMIDHRYQRKGYGRDMIAQIVALMRNDNTCDEITLSTASPVAEKLYASLGFVRTGEMDGDENVMLLRWS